MSRDPREGPTAAEVHCFACGNTRLPSNPPTVAVFVRGGLVQDVCFDGAVRVIVADFDCEDERPSALIRHGIYTDPADGRASRVQVSVWTRTTYDRADDSDYVRAALKAFTDPYAPFRDNEEERARIERELEEGSE